MVLRETLNDFQEGGAQGGGGDRDVSFASEALHVQLQLLEGREIMPERCLLLDDLLLHGHLHDRHLLRLVRLDLVRSHLLRGPKRRRKGQRRRTC